MIWRKFFSRDTATTRPMTEAESRAFDTVFVKANETFAAMDKLFNVVRDSDTHPKGGDA